MKLTILNSFSSHSEEVKSAASYTLGNIAIGNLPEYLPFILQEIEAQPKRQYLLLHSLKEVIIFVSIQVYRKMKLFLKYYFFADYHKSINQSIWRVTLAEFRAFDLDALI